MDFSISFVNGRSYEVTNARNAENAIVSARAVMNHGIRRPAFVPVEAVDQLPRMAERHWERLGIAVPLPSEPIGTPLRRDEEFEALGGVDPDFKHTSQTRLLATPGGSAS